MRRKRGPVLMGLGAMLICAALALFGWNRWEDYQAGNALDEILPRIKALSGEADPDGDGTDTSGSDQTAAWIGGYEYIGYVTIPTLGLELPVMSSWSYEQLRTAPCRYTGSVETGDLVIAAHNYSTHFGRIKYLSDGDPVYFTDMEGEQTAFEVALVDTLSPYAVDEMTDSGYPLTLFTCTYGGQSRVTVRCTGALSG